MLTFFFGFVAGVLLTTLWIRLLVSYFMRRDRRSQFLPHPRTGRRG